MLSMSSSHLIPAIYRSCLIGRRCSTIPDTGGRSSPHISILNDAAAMSIMLMSPHELIHSISRSGCWGLAAFWTAAANALRSNP